MSAPGTKTKPSLRLSISLCSLASCELSHKTHTHFRERDRYSRWHKYKSRLSSESQLCPPLPVSLEVQIQAKPHPKLQLSNLLFTPHNVLSFQTGTRRDETAFLIPTHLTIIMKCLRIIWCTVLHVLAEMPDHAVQEAPVLGNENRRTRGYTEVGTQSEWSKPNSCLALPTVSCNLK